MKIELSEHEINIILNALSEKPYKDVHYIIQHILDQVTKNTE